MRFARYGPFISEKSKQRGKPPLAPDASVPRYPPLRGFCPRNAPLRPRYAPATPPLRPQGAFPRRGPQFRDNLKNCGDDPQSMMSSQTKP
jgi:hypothetical protein